MVDRKHQPVVFDHKPVHREVARARADRLRLHDELRLAPQDASLAVAQEDARLAVDDGRHQADHHLVSQGHHRHKVDVVLVADGVTLELQRGKRLQRIRSIDRMARKLHVPPAGVSRVDHVEVSIFELRVLQLSHVRSAKEIGVAPVVCGRQLAIKLAHLDPLPHVQAVQSSRLLLVEDQLRARPRDRAVAANLPNCTVQPRIVGGIERLGGVRCLVT